MTRPVVVVAPDAFKGSCSATEAAAAIARGLQSVWAESVDVRLCPMADGGEGSLAVLTAPLGLDLVAVETVDAHGRPRSAQIGITPDGRTAVIEAAMANGLPHVADVDARPRQAHTGGVGLLLRAALDRGVEEVLLAIGGSASSDGGVGALRALGCRFLDSAGEEIAVGAAGLAALVRIDTAGLHPRTATVRLRVLADVDNPLLGPRGTATVFAPQKGADADDVAAIEAGLAHLADVIAASGGVEVAQTPGGGAAGGTPATLVGLLDARIEPGSTVITDLAGLPALAQSAALVITGEGAFDAQSLDGKVVSAVSATVAGRCPLAVLAGRVDVPLKQAQRAGVSAMFSIARGPAPLADLVRDVTGLLEQAAANIAALVGPQDFLRPKIR
ncbi:glycerate kinase [Nocardioides sp.]|uniref:glycerate kinase family protein n=1 Tax=Nocardioides sp. TaxID=35761 RepID=UPI002610B415|nr:glycerate kinase [Nocardioides sp.]